MARRSGSFCTWLGLRGCGQVAWMSAPQASGGCGGAGVACLLLLAPGSSHGAAVTRSLWMGVSTKHLPAGPAEPWVLRTSRVFWQARAPKGRCIKEPEKPQFLNLQEAEKSPKPTQFRAQPPGGHGEMNSSCARDLGSKATTVTVLPKPALGNWTHQCWTLQKQRSRLPGVRGGTPSDGAVAEGDLAVRSHGMPSAQTSEGGRVAPVTTTPAARLTPGRDAAASLLIVVSSTPGKCT